MVRRWLKTRGTSMAEAAITLPVLVLLTFAMINLTLAGYAAVAASNAANYGARIGAVAQENPIAYATAAAQERVDAIGIGSFTVTASGGGSRGSQVIVLVDWAVPNYLGSLLSWLGGSDALSFSGTAQSAFRQEGW